jgi:DNA-directed RNA polymerase beta' subunit
LVKPGIDVPGFFTYNIIIVQHKGADIMATATKKSITMREHAKRDHSPKWDDAGTWTGEKFTSHFRSAMNYYNLNNNNKDLKPKVIDWMGRNGYDTGVIKQFKNTKDHRCGLTMGAIASCLLRGMPAVHPGFNKGRDTEAWLKSEIAKVLEDGARDEVPVEDSKTEIKVTVTVNIQDRIREQAVNMSEEIDGAIDSWILDAEAFDPKAFKMVNLLRGRGAKSAQARYIKSFFQKGYNELLELASGNADEQLREAYRHNSRKNVKKLIDFYESIFTACDQIAQEAKTLKKPRAKKIKPAEDLVKKIKFKVSDDKLGISSVPAAGIIGAQAIVVYNTKNRKIGVYLASSSAGLNVKGASIVDFTVKSFQKTLRKPDLQIKEFKEQNTQRRVETWFEKIKATETVLNGRINAEVMILKVFK